MNIAQAFAVSLGMEDGTPFVEFTAECGCCATRAYFAADQLDELAGQLHFHAAAARHFRRGAVVVADGGRA